MARAFSFGIVDTTPISITDPIPSALVSIVSHGPNGFENSIVDFSEYIEKKNIVLVGYPGCFTPTCMTKHLPKFIGMAESIKSRGADEILALSVNDPFVATAFAEYMGGKHLISYLADGNGELTRSLGLNMNLTSVAMGDTRTQRFSMIIKRNKVLHLNIERGAEYTEVSSAEKIL
eukprot:CAMPEP_0170505730 /NCGR_PEP_ID=MMETSP0208-20121228/52052_1 /TAXON_ID=197538 /ORGANISM="Strombidium inclinatum, Strain S3" /LENGTH=175 /DNA_ID=CAMNT_0010786797 /DNA_START=37 /DNA_END=561 /DNA_ORIENTATION=+